MRSVAKGLFNGLEVVSLPAFSRLLLLAVRDAPTLNPQLRLIAQVRERQRDRGVVLCGAGKQK